jgi:hypothetical protein
MRPVSDLSNTDFEPDLKCQLTRPSVASISRTGVSRTLATKQNVSGVVELAEGYQVAALIASGWEKDRGNAMSIVSSMQVLLRSACI